MFEPAGVLFVILREIHPLHQGCFALSVAFIQIEVSVWIVELCSLLSLFKEHIIYSLASSGGEFPWGAAAVCFVAA